MRTIDFLRLLIAFAAIFAVIFFADALHPPELPPPYDGIYPYTVLFGLPWVSYYLIAFHFPVLTRKSIFIRHALSALLGFLLAVLTAIIYGVWLVLLAGVAN